MKPTPAQNILPKYKAIFLDSYGVIKNYRGLIPGVDKTFQEIRAAGQALYILTNDASRSPEQLADNFHKLGLKDIDPAHIVSSGMMAGDYIRHKIKTGRVAFMGTYKSAHYIKQAGLEAISVSRLSLDKIDDISALVFLDDEGFDWNHDITKAINLLRHRNIPVVVANSDMTYPIAKNEVAVATGGIARLVENIVQQEFIHFGKPDLQMFFHAYEHLSEKTPIERDEILMVGDTLETDIMGGNKFGLHTALTLTGNASPERYKTRIKSSGIFPDYIFKSIGDD